VPVRERDSIHTVVHKEDDYGGNVVYEVEGMRILYEREEDSPEEQGDDDLKGKGHLVKEDTPLPQQPGRVDVLVIPNHRVLCLLVAVLSDCEQGEEGVGGCGEEDAPHREVDKGWVLIFNQMIQAETP
jgi:hypothetical protein